MKLSQNQILGTIHIYTVAGYGKYANGEDRDYMRNDLLKEVIKCTKSWKQETPEICTIILGGLQETVTTLDQDNMGDFRAELREKGILKHILDSHTSIVRENMSGEQ